MRVFIHVPKYYHLMMTYLYIQLVQSMPWSSLPKIDTEWKRKLATDILNNLSEARFVELEVKMKRTIWNLSQIPYYYIYYQLWKDSLNSDGHQFHQYQQNNHFALKWDVGNAGPGFFRTHWTNIDCFQQV